MIKYKWLRIVIRVTGWFLIGLTALLLLLELLILLPPVQRKLKDVAVKAIEDNLDVKASIGYFRLGFPTRAKVGEILMVADDADTLVSVGTFSVNIAILPMLQKKIMVRNVALRQVRGDIGKVIDRASSSGVKGAHEAPPEPAPARDEAGGKPWTFAVRHLDLEDLDLEFRDETAGIDLNMKVGRIGIGLGEIDLDSLIHVKSVSIARTDLTLELLETAPSAEEPDTGAFSFANITVGRLDLEKVGFTLVDSTGMMLFTHAGSLSARDNFVDITNAVIGVDEVELADSWCDIVFLPAPGAEVPAADTAGSPDGLSWGESLWRITGNRLAMENCRYTMEYKGEPELESHFDPLHMHITEASGEISGFILDTDTLVAKIYGLQAKEKNGIELLRFDAGISQQDTVLLIDGLRLETRNTTVEMNLETSARLADYSGFGNEAFDLDLKVTGANWKDVDYFYPFLAEQDILTDSFGTGNFELEAGISGGLASLDVRRLRFQLQDSTVVDMEGTVTNAMDPGALVASLNIREIRTSRNELDRNFNLGLSDSTFTVPEWMRLAGHADMESNFYRFGGELMTSNGRINIKDASARMGDLPHYTIAMAAGLDHLDSLFHMGIDRLAFQMDADVQGDDPAAMEGMLTLSIDSLEYQSFVYRAIGLEGMIDNGSFSFGLQSAMPECQVRIQAKGAVSDTSLAVDLATKVGNLDLRALHLNDEKFTITGNADISVETYPADAWDVMLNLKQLDIDYKDSLYRMHPVELTFSTGQQHTDLSLASHFYHLVFEADASMDKVADAFIHLPGYYLSDPSEDTIRFAMPEFSVEGSLVYPKDFAALFFPGLPEFDEFKISGGYSGATDVLKVDLFFPFFSTGSLSADSLYFSLDGSSEELDYRTGADLEIDGLMSGEARIEGSFRDSELTTYLVYSDSYNHEYLNLGAKIDTASGNVLVRLLPPALTFSYDPWQVDPDNLVTVNPGYIAFDHFNLTNGREMITINSSPEQDPDKVELKLTDFSLGSLEQLFAMDTVVAGTANADIVFHDPPGRLAVAGSFSIDDFLLYDFEAGRLDIPHFSTTADTSSVQLTVKGPKQDLALTGQWIASDTLNPMAVTLAINSLNLAELNYLLEEYISDAKGQLKGEIQVTGTPSSPLVNGSVRFTDAGMEIDFLNNYLTFGTESITVEDNVVRFDDFSIRNKQDQAATIKGKLNLGDISQAYSDLTVKTDNMEIMNSTKKENDILFGLLKARVEAAVRGVVGDIRIQSTITIDRETNVTYIFPDNLALDNNEGIVRYEKFEPVMKADEDISKSGSFFSMQSFRNVSSTVEVEPGARFNLFFDKSGSNYLDAALTGSISYSQVQENTEVSGMFQVDKGVLHYDIPMVTVNEYTIEPGSSITLSNDLYNPYLDIVAYSNVRASTEGLMATDPKVMTFKILLYMEGELNDIKLHFDISQETGDALVSARLAQLTDEERNVNALNLLVRGSFMMSLQGDEVGGTTTMDAQIDKFYATHLNKLISENVGFVDLKFDVQSYKDYNTSGETVIQRNYYYNLGKSIFNDRARINYKGSLGVTGDVQSAPTNSQFVQNELELEVNITRDGVLRGVFFRKNRYEGLLEGEVIETGGGIRLKKDFYSIGDIFMSEKKLEQRENSKSQNSND